MLGTVHVPVVPDSCDSPRAGTVWAHVPPPKGAVRVRPLIQEFSPSFCRPWTMEQHLPKHHGISEQLFIRNLSPNQKSPANFASGMKQKPVFFAPSLSQRPHSSFLFTTAGKLSGVSIHIHYSLSTSSQVSQGQG